jgi:hypothetical protein
MIEVKVEKPANLLKISYVGTVGAEEARESAQKIESLLGDLEPGFRMLTDMRNLKIMDLACVPYIERVMDACDEAGIKMVVRIIPDPHKDIGLNIMAFFHYDRGVQIINCQTLPEAERILAK